jgi:ribonuclease D
MLAQSAVILIPARRLGATGPPTSKGTRVFAHDDETLAKVASAARESGMLALDTEFMREKTYYAKLCLLQFGAGDGAWIVDPFVVSDLGPVAEVLADRSVVKVMHAGIQDVEILTRLLGEPPAPVFDTQVAATLAGFPAQVGYARLVKELYDVDIDKSDTYSDWSRRPLTPAQIEYALADVRYLPRMYVQLKERLEAEGRLAWLQADFERLSDPATYDVVPEEQFRRIKRVTSLSRRQMGVLQHAAAWREREAQRRDLPRRWVLSDETLVEVARRQPKDTGALGELRGLNTRALGDGGQGLLSAVLVGLAMSDAELPRITKRPRTVVDIEGVVELMGALLRVRAIEHGVAVPLLATRADLERLAAGEREDSALLQGWRKSIIGDALVDLVEGRLSLRVADGKVVPKAVEPTAEAPADATLEALAG